MSHWDPTSASERGIPLVPPLRVLAVVASPSDLPRFDVEHCWRQLEEALGPLTGQGSLVVERVKPATEVALRSQLDHQAWHVLHFIGHGRGRAAQYNTIALESSDGRSRGMTERYFAQLVHSHPSLRLVVLQSRQPDAADFRPMAGTLMRNGSTSAFVTGSLPERAQQIFLAKLYAGILLQLDPAAVVREVQTALADQHLDANGLALASQHPEVPLFARAQPECPPASLSTAPTAAQVPVAVLEGGGRSKEASLSVEMAAELERQRASCQFDVFLCHNGADKPAVKRIGQWLKSRGVLPWLDSWELPPGQPWQVLLEKQIGHIKSAAVLVGSAGVGPWQEQEIYGFLREFVSRRCPVIPVLLQDAPAKPELPLFLRTMTWVDFRCDDPDPYEQLCWGITGNRPNHDAA